ncbi:ankyrin repeat domain-containing protein 29 [Culex quinquefasciatus]|uniref:Ankyrin repeat domain-containing protein 29 n=1 Tax=Culex quinquefasciatus TaxID=7176 RepID=B0X7Z4_CULQU|nr:ankyrin repeat domain-containing protein 29 [Culex quinquefasciatus]|eukprot:XP_001865766.1 ankyrin repeat domain-containing protein 29 [Culex quinquefasciatus]
MFCLAGNQNQQVASGTLSPIEDDAVGNLNLVDAVQCGVRPKPEDLAGSASAAATLLHHAPGATGQVTAADGSQQQQPKFVFNVDAAAPNGRSAGVDSGERVRNAHEDSQKDQERQINVDSVTDSNHDTALPLACAGGHEELVELLISRDTNIKHNDKKGSIPLILAATAGHEKVVETLLRHGAKMEAQYERTKDTPLSLVCSGGRYEVVELLLDMNANRENRNVPDYTLLSLAASGGYVKIITLLLSHGVEINSQMGSNGSRPVGQGADVNVAPVHSLRDTVLTIAADKGQLNFVELLLSCGAAVEVKNKKGNSPLWIAANGGHLTSIPRTTQPPPQQTIAFIRENLHQLQSSSSSINNSISRTKRKVETPASTPTAKARARARTSLIEQKRSHGTKIAKELKQVTSNMQTHKNLTALRTGPGQFESVSESVLKF